MGILNITPDSFADGGRRLDPDVAIAAAIRMVEQGADILDIGGESTRPGAAPVDAVEEWRRVEPVLTGLRGRVDVPISIDTYKASVADCAIDLGAELVNDVTGFAADPAMPPLVARRGVAAILMHNRGQSADMYALARYDDVVRDVVRELETCMARAEAGGVTRERIVLDPGLGFAKRAAHTFEMCARFDELAALGRPLLAGPSRKSFLKTPLGDVPPEARVWGTAAAVTATILGGAHIIRVHDVAEMAQVAKVADAIAKAINHPRTPEPLNP
jgi:dihydropteroate synthase